VSPFDGALKVIASEKVVYEKSFTPADGPMCVCCERRVSALEYSTPPTCKSCSTARITTNYYPFFQEETVETIAALKVKMAAHERCSQTLVFLTAKKSGKSDALDADIFDAVWRSVLRSER
jgi:hypothetical protein